MKCEMCNGTGFVGDNGPGIKGNSEYVPCECAEKNVKPANSTWERIAELEAEVERLKGAMRMIQMASGAPNPAGALRTVLDIAATALEGKDKP